MCLFPLKIPKRCNVKSEEWIQNKTKLFLNIPEPLVLQYCSIPSDINTFLEITRNIISKGTTCLFPEKDARDS